MTINQICKLPGAPWSLRETLATYREDWRPLRYPGVNMDPDQYLINSQGRVINTRTWRASPKLTENMRIQSIYLNRFEHYVVMPRAEAVLHTFVGPPAKPKTKSIFIDGNKYNYNLENLRWE